MLKKILLLGVLFLTSCQNINPSSSTFSSSGSSSSSSSFSYEEFLGGSKLIFTEVMTGALVNNRALEISNIGEESINLDGYSIKIFRHGVDKPHTEEIKLTGSLDSNKSYVIAYSLAKEEIRAKADLVTNLYMNDGTFALTLSKDNKYVDIIGTRGYNYDYAKNVTLIRKKEFFETSETYFAYGYIKYECDYIDGLGNIDVISNDILFEGPKLTEVDRDRPFVLEGTTGGGGITEVSLAWTSDGDTSGFDYGSTYSSYGISGSESTRYYGINTPEIAHSFGEESDPYGEEAKEFTNSILRKSKSIIIQTARNNTFRETYGRMLGYVWVSEKSNPELSDYQLLNFLIIKNGFSRVAFLSRSDNINDMKYEGISYAEYLFDIENYASWKKLNLFSI